MEIIGHIPAETVDNREIIPATTVYQSVIDGSFIIIQDEDSINISKKTIETISKIVNREITP